MVSNSSTNELTLTRKIHKILNFINVGSKKIEIKYATIPLLLTLNNHFMRIWQAIKEVRDVYNTVIKVCLHWRNGIMHPQLLPPSRLIQILKISQDSFSRDLEFLVLLSEAYAYVLIDILSVDVYLVGNSVYCSGLIGFAICVQCV